MSQYKGTRDPSHKAPQQNAQPTLGKTIAKIAVGAIIIVIGLEDIFTDFTFFLFTFIIGAALIAWGLIPYMQARRKEKEEEVERILNTPLKKEEEMDEAERLAQKYYK